MSFHQTAGTEPRQKEGAEPISLTARRVRGTDAPRGAGGSKNNLPHAASEFVGRREDIVEVGSLLDRSRLVTLTGMGGMGKTRLALEVANRATFRYPEGVWLVELGDFGDTAYIPEAVADAITPRDSRVVARTTEEVAEQIGAQHMLLVLDNCEHMVHASAVLVEQLLRSCPALDVLATSREALGIVGERSWIVRPLSLPPRDDVSSESLAASEAGELFIHRASEVKHRFKVADAMASTVADICRRLDGMPLAIELAAMRVTSLSPANILERLEDRFRLLNGGSPTAPARHQTLLAALEWSHDLLSADEAALLRRVSVFAGWSLAAAEEVCDSEPLDGLQIVDLLAALVGKSLVIVEEREEGLRYHLLETVRAWARTKLEASGEGAAVHEAHTRWCVGVAEGADAELGGRFPKPWLDELELEHTNLRTALARAHEAGEVAVALRLITALTTFWRFRGHIQEANRWLGWAVEASGDATAAIRAKVLRAAGLVRGELGDIVSALPLLDQSSALYTESGDHDASLCTCNTTFLMSRNPRQALPILEEKASQCRRNGDTNGLAHLLSSIGQVHVILCACDEARRCFHECTQLGRGAADAEALRSGLQGLARVDLILGDLIGAEGWAAESLVEADAANDDDDAALALDYMGEAARLRGQWDRARKLAADGVARARDGAMPVGIARALYFQARLAESEGDDAAGELYERALSIALAGRAPVFHEVRCRLGLGAAAETRGELHEAARHLLEAHELSQGVGDHVVSAEALLRLSIVSQRQGKADEASVLGHRSLELYQRIGALPGLASCLEALAGLSAEARPEAAVRLYAGAQAIREPQGLARSVPEQARYEGELAQVRSTLGPERFAAAWSEGSSLSVEEVGAYALRGRRTGERPVTGWESLTSAEKEVVRLVCQGLSNPEVGKRLFISPRTVGHHLSHVFDKLGIRSRGALTKELAGRDL